MIRYWFTYKMPGSKEAHVDTFHDEIEAWAKWAEKSKLAEEMSRVAVMDVQEEIECMHAAIRFWANRGYYGSRAELGV